jgi:predicted AlkP superfamily phosphohydrolase/phosphomutase
LVSKLKALDYRLDVDSQVAHESLDLFLSDLDKTLEARVQTYRYLWESQDWQVFMLVFTGTDRLMHFLWSAYEDKGHKYHHDFLRHFHEIDEVIGEINARMKEEDTLVILSDHGFEGLDLDVYVNYLLKKEGFLKTKKGEEPTLENIDPLTKAFALDPARIYVNLKDRYPNGGINKDDKEKVLKDLEDLFASFEIEGRSVIKDIYRGEEIYSGPCLDKAPDLILEGNHGFNLKADIKADTLTRKGIFTGKHTRDNAFFLLGAKEDIMYPVDNLHVSDAISIIYKGRVV